MRGLILRPAGVPVLLIFEDPNPQLWEGAVRAWGALDPEQVEDAATRLPEFERVAVLTQRSRAEVLEKLGQVQELTLVRSADPASSAERLTVEVTMHLLKELAGSAHLLHAAVLGDAGRGRAFALVAPSGTGKTTASRFLGQNFTYLTDETAVVMPDLSVRPYAKPLSVIETRGEPKVQHNPAELGLKVADAGDYSFTLQNVIILNRVQEEQTEPRLERLPLVAALLEVSGQSSGMHLTEKGLEQMALLLNRTGGALKLTYSEISETLPLLQALVRGEQDAGGTVEELDYIPAAAFEAGAQEAEAADLYQRVEGSEGLAAGDRFVISAGSSLSEVSVFAWDCWAALTAPASGQELRGRLQEIYGEIPAEDFEESLTSMEKAGLICKVGARR